MEHLGPILTPCAKFDYDRFTIAEALNPQIMSLSVSFFFPFFSLIFQTSLTGLQPKPLNRFRWLMAQTTCSRISKCFFESHMITSLEMWAWLPKNPLFGACFGQNVIRCQECTKISVPRRLSIRFQSTRAQKMWFLTRLKVIYFWVPNFDKANTGPRKPRKLRVKGTAKISNNQQKSIFSDLNKTPIKR
jgi:hypothetical protein